MSKTMGFMAGLLVGFFMMPMVVWLANVEVGPIHSILWLASMIAFPIFGAKWAKGRKV